MAPAEAQLQDFPSLFSLKGKVAVVTGGSRGLGLTAASALLQAGASKVFISSRKAKACDEAVQILNSQPNLQPGAKAISVPADCATEQGVKDLVAQVSKQTDHVDILLANAGASWGEGLDTHPDSAIAKVFDLNVRGVFNTIKLFTPLLEKRGSKEDPSRVVITASVGGINVGATGKQGTYGYSASKAAAIHLGNNLSLELGPRGITVNNIAPGLFPSKMADGLIELSGGSDMLAAFNPMGRLGRPEDIAGAIVFLCSRASSHVNGATLVIDGGSQWHRGELTNYQPKL